MSFIYTVDHFAPFPISEYGGVWVVIAENDDECFDLIAEYDQEDNISHYSKLKENIIKSEKYQLKDEYNSKVVCSFTT